MLARCREEVFRPSFEANNSTAVLLDAISRISLGFAGAGKFTEAVFLAESINEPEYDGTLHADIGVILCKAGNKSKGASLFAKAIKIAKNLYYASSTAYAYFHLAERFYDLHNPQKSEEMLARTLRIINHQLEKSEFPHKTILMGKITEMYLALDNVGVLKIDLNSCPAENRVWRHGA